MKKNDLKALSDFVDEITAEPAFTKMSLADLGNEKIIRRQLQVELEKHLRAHESTEALVARIQKVAAVNRNRAMTAAQTEKTRTLSTSRVAKTINQYLADHEKAVKNHHKRPDPPYGQWINPRTAKEPRHQHVAISGTIRPLGQEFLPGLRMPGDPAAPPSQTIRCHCYLRILYGSKVHR